jgi:hypothetical protein
MITRLTKDNPVRQAQYKYFILLLILRSVALLYVIVGNYSRQGGDAGAGRRPTYTQTAKVVFLRPVESVCVPNPNDYRNTELVLLVGIKSPTFQNFGSMNGNGVAAGIKGMAEKLRFLPFAVNPHDDPIQGQDHTRRVANVETYKEWSLSSSFRNPPLHVIDAGDYTVNINPLLQLSLLHPDTFFRGLRAASHEYGLSLNEVRLFLDSLQRPDSNVYSTNPDNKQEESASNSNVIEEIFFYNHVRESGNRNWPLWVFITCPGVDSVALAGGALLGWGKRRIGWGSILFGFGVVLSNYIGASIGCLPLNWSLCFIHRL